MSDAEVGKVSLGLELVGGSDLSKQITLAAGTIGEQLTKSLKATFGGFSLKGFASNISQTLKTTTETAMKGIVDGMEQAVAAVEGRLVKSIDTASQAMKQSIEENKTAAEQAIDSISEKLSGLKGPKFLENLKLSGDITAGAQAACCCDGAGSTAGKRTQTAKTKAAPEPFDADAAAAEVEHLTKVLDNTNAKLELQHKKLADLKESYENTFNDAKKSKIQEKILNTESAILRLTKQSDDTAAKIWKLQDAIDQAATSAKQAAQASTQVTTATQQMGQAASKAAASNQQVAHTASQAAAASQQAGKAAGQAGQSTGQASQQTNRANKSTNKLTNNLHNAAKAAAGASSSFDNAGRSAGKMGNHFTQAFSRILKQVFVFSVLYRAVHDFNSYLFSSLKTNQQFAASLNAIQTNLRVAFQPIYEAILPAINALMSFLAKATAYIAAFISALFGKTYQDSYKAAKNIETAKKAMEGYGKKAKKAGKDAKGALASFDELNTLDFSKADTGVDDGAGGPKNKGFEMQMPDMDIAGIQAQMDKLAADVKAAFDSAWKGVKSGWDWLVSTFGPSFRTAWGEISPVLDRWKEQFKKMFSDIMTLGEPLKNWILTGLVPYWQQGIQLAGHVLAGLLDVVLQIVTSIWDAAFPILSKFVSEGLPRLTEFMMGVQEIFRKLFDLVKKIFDDIWQGAVDPAMKLISKVIQDTLDIIFKWWDEWGKKIMNGLKASLDGIKKLWENLWNSFLKPFVTNMLDMLTWLWDKHLKGLVQEIGTFVGKLITAAQDIFNKFILPIVNWLVQKLGPTFSNIFSLIGDVIGTALAVISDVAKGIIKALGGVIDFIAGVFTGDWKRAWEGIKTIFSGIADAIVGIFKGAVNLVIDAVNFLIRQLNKVKIDVPEWVSKIPGMPKAGTSIGFDVPTIPKLAKGGLAYGPTLAMVGDNRGAGADPEVISPLSKLQEMLGSNNQGIVEVLMMILEAIRNQDNRAVLQIGETELGRIVIKAINSAQRQAGRTLLDV
ncbi:hypothetical protein [Paenibacillus azoreducens]|uniref:Uncharacterized protein n=1 Tax=Paenibacillus azoreducens TaxID=116718 RepID=A0A919YL79_9BACL|nr:hypothetical protein [Paenibacillus azoreducens]GIO51563.1 hypothetical protein J34TS1_63280 [Paenibacillus azoreducens]